MVPKVLKQSILSLQNICLLKLGYICKVFMYIKVKDTYLCHFNSWSHIRVIPCFRLFAMSWVHSQVYNKYRKLVRLNKNSASDQKN